MTEISIIKIVALLVLGFSLWAGNKTFITMMSNIDRFGDDEKGNHKYKVAIRALHNFWVGFAGVIIIVSGILELIDSEIFILLLKAVLIALGAKLTVEFVVTLKKR
jgi:hypothetical protein